MGKHYMLTSGHVPKQVLEVMVCSPWRQCWFMCHWCKINCPQYSTMELVLSHHESRYIRYQYSYMIVERRTILLWPNNDWQTELVSKELSRADWTECIEIDLNALLLEAMGFVHNEDNDDLSSTHVTSKTCSVTPGEQMYLLSLFVMWLEKEQLSHCDITKADGLNWFLKEVPNTNPT